VGPGIYRQKRRSRIGRATGFVSAYQYDDLGRMTQVTQESQSGGNLVAEKRVDFTYNPLGQFTSVTRYSDVAGLCPVATSEYTFDDLARLVSLEHSTATSATRDYGWQYDSLNRISQYTTPDFTVDYTYDDTSQLVGADYDASGPADETYDYDANGNRIMSGYVTGDHNRLLSDGTYSYTYDEEGNRVTRTHLVTGDVDTYTWDHRNRLVSVVTTDVLDDETQRVEFVYDAFDRRVEKRADTDADGLWNTYERFVYDGEHIALVFDEAGSLTNRYLHGPAIDQILADEQLTSGLLAPGDVVWPLTDHLGTVCHLANSAGNIINDRVYDSFGQLLSETNPSVTHRFGFTGREWDAELGLNYHRARYYDVGVGKWISEDPIGFTAGDANLGRYVGNQPTSFFDLYGESQSVGHHWVPQAVLEALYRAKLITKAAFETGMGAVSGQTTPNHGGGPRGGVQHLEYNDIVREEFEVFRNSRGLAKVGSKDMKDFIKNIRDGMSGDGCEVNDKLKSFNDAVRQERAAYLERHPRAQADLYQDESKWRATGQRELRRKEYFKNRHVASVLGMLLASALGNQISQLNAGEFEQHSDDLNKKYLELALKSIEENDLHGAQKWLLENNGNNVCMGLNIKLEDTAGVPGFYVGLTVEQAIRSAFEHERLVADQLFEQLESDNQPDESINRTYWQWFWGM
jgi:RHS repeat-associated protein